MEKLLVQRFARRQLAPTMMSAFLNTGHSSRQTTQELDDRFPTETDI